MPTEGEIARFYGSEAWKRLSLGVRGERKVCERCAAWGRTRGAAVVHHREPVRKAWHLRWDQRNLEALCWQCHERVHKRRRRAWRPPSERQIARAMWLRDLAEQYGIKSTREVMT